jgi:hypothetical protein
MLLASPPALAIVDLLSRVRTTTGSAHSTLETLDRRKQLLRPLVLRVRQLSSLKVMIEFSSAMRIDVVAPSDVVKGTLRIDL